MSFPVHQSASPFQGPAGHVVESPKGHCCFILVQPGVHGQRCACTNFQHNKALPGSICDCGHQSCFHRQHQESLEQKQEIEQLKRRLQHLEHRLSLGNQDGLDRVFARVTEAEENMERQREEFEAQLKRTCQNLKLVWGMVDQGSRKLAQHDQQLRHVDAKLGDHEERFRKVDDRQLELQDADLSLEERIDDVVDTLGEDEEEEEQVAPKPSTGRPRRRSASDLSRYSSPTHFLGDIRRPMVAASSVFAISPSLRTVPHFRRRRIGAKSTGAWTVHISLLPHRFDMMPFERNTKAYQRCLSRGLHRTVAINGEDASSFASAVSKAFGYLLKGRPWMPLQAKLCDAQRLQGLPMLLPLDPAMADSSYDAEFLRRYCAVCDSEGTMDSLYIAMKNHSLSWHALRLAPVYLDGLEASWGHDPLLDTDPYDGGFSVDQDVRPAAGDFVSLSNTSAKRGSSEISRSDSFSAYAATLMDVDGRAKGICPVAPKLRRHAVGSFQTA